MILCIGKPDKRSRYPCILQWTRGCQTDSSISPDIEFEMRSVRLTGDRFLLGTKAYIQGAAGGNGDALVGGCLQE